MEQISFNQSGTVRYHLYALLKNQQLASSKTRLVWAALLVALCLSVSVLPIGNLALAHSGGTNKYGCHAGSKPYHCH